MRTALFLLLLLAFASIPGSVYPQRSADPNGVRLFFENQPEFAKVLDSIQIFDVYTSVWFSAIYILLFVSLIGCVVPRTKIHWVALFAKPVATPKNLARMPAYEKLTGDESFLEAGFSVLRRAGFRIAKNEGSLSAEKGYTKETGNLVFHYSLIGVLVAVGLGGGYSFSGQRVLVEGDTFVNNLSSYDSFSPGPFFSEDNLQAFDMTLDKFVVTYDLTNLNNRGQPIDFIATVTSLGKTSDVRVNQPLSAPGANVYLTGNGFAPVITVRDGEGEVAFSGPSVFLPQDSNMSSLGVIKVPDANPSQLGFISFFYPTAEKLESGAYTSIYPDPFLPLLTLNLYTGDLGLDSGIPRNVFALDTSNLTEVASRNAENPPIELEPGQTAQLPDGLGSVSFDGLVRFASLDVAYNPGGIWVLLFALIALGSLALSLMTPRRRIWLQVAGSGKVEAAGLSKNDDPGLEEFLKKILKDIDSELSKKTGNK